MPNLTLLAPNSSPHTLSKIENYKIIKNIVNKIIKEKRRKDNLTPNSAIALADAGSACLALKRFSINLWQKKYNQKQSDLITCAAFKHTKEKSQETFTAIFPARGIRWSKS